MVTRIDEPSVEEGDCRYLSRDIMNEDYTQLAKADIFSLGCSLYEAASGHELPKNGPEWHKVRRLTAVPGYAHRLLRHPPLHTTEIRTCM